MDGVNSPIREFYPTEFDLDLNGKKQDWEAIVKIPFMSEERLLDAMSSTYLIPCPGRKQLIEASRQGASLDRGREETK